MPYELYVRLYSHQQEALKFMISCSKTKNGLVLAHEMGLGKTRTCIAAMLSFMYKNDGSYSLIVASPTLLHEIWKPELDALISTRLMNHSYEFLKSSYKLMPQTIYLCTYDEIRKDAGLITKDAYIVVDEAHEELLTTSNKLYQTLTTCSSPYRVLSTGTPLKNNFTDLWNLCEIARPGFLGPLSDFSKFFQERSDARFKVFQVLKEIVIHSRDQACLDTKLPAKHTCVIGVPVDEDCISQSIKCLSSPVKELSKLQDKLYEKKQGVCISLINFFRAKYPQDSILVFSSRQNVCVWLHAVFADSVLVHGKVIQERKKLFNSFNTGKVKLMFLTTGVGSCGLNLTVANRAILFEPSWNFSEDDQAIGRICRIGQAKTCHVFRLVAMKTIREHDMLSVEENMICLASMDSG